MGVSPGNFPVTQENVVDAYKEIFAPWVQAQGLKDFTVAEGRVTACLPFAQEQAFWAGAICGQAIMSAIDTVVALAMCTTERSSKGTIYQHTHFLRPATGDAFEIDARIMRFGKATAYAEASVTDIATGDLIARASAEFAF